MTRAAALLALLSVVAAPLAAQDTCPCPPPPPPPPLWTGSLGFSYLATSGNSESQSIGLTATAARQPTPWGLEAQVLANRAESEGDKTAERTLAGLRAKRALGDRLQLFAGTSYERDVFAGFDSRFVLEGGAIWRGLSGPVHELDLDVGLVWTDEQPSSGAGFDYLGALAGLTYTWKVNTVATFRERLVVYPSFDDSDDWRLRSDLGLEAALASSWALRVGYLYTRDNLPAPGFDKADSVTSVSLLWRR